MKISRQLILLVMTGFLGCRTSGTINELKQAPGDGADKTPAAPAGAKVIPGTVEALTVFPALNQEQPFEPSAEAIEFSLFEDVINIMQDELRNQHKPQKPHTLRGFHAKAHGCLAGKLYVVGNPEFPAVYTSLYGNDLVAKTRKGIFDPASGEAVANSSQFSHALPVLVRYSNSQGKYQSDRNPDGKGMAMKVLGPGGQDHDFTMSDTPTCNSKTAAHFMAFGMALAGIHKEIQLPTDADLQFENSPMHKRIVERLKVKKQNLGDQFPPTLNFLVDGDNTTQRAAVKEMIKSSVGMTNSIDLQYWSRTPYHLGPDHAVKFSAIPRKCCVAGNGFEAIAGCQNNQSASGGFLSSVWKKTQSVSGTLKTKISERITKLKETDSFRANLMRSAMDNICFDFAYQFQTDSKNTPVENPTIGWTNALAPLVVFAKVVLPAQEFDSEEQNSFCEDLSFTPGHFLPEHEPMGHMNRARIAVYDSSTKHRQQNQRDAKDYPVHLLKP